MGLGPDGVDAVTALASRLRGPGLRLPVLPGRPVAAARRRVRIAVDPVMPMAAPALPAAGQGAARAQARRADPVAAVGRTARSRAADPVRAVLARPAAPLPSRALPGVDRAQPGAIAGLDIVTLEGPGAVRVVQRDAAAPPRAVRGAEPVALRPLAAASRPVPPGPIVAAAPGLVLRLPGGGLAGSGLALPGPMFPGPVAPGMPDAAPISPVLFNPQPVAPRTARPLPPGAEAPERDNAPSAAAPASGGTVLLDGQLVGQWLMDRMARDAERPPAGLTGFDVRQAPSWSVG